MHPSVVAVLLGLVAGFILSLIFVRWTNPPTTTMLNDTEKYIANIRALLWITNTLLGGILGLLLWQATQ